MKRKLVQILGLLLTLHFVLISHEFGHFLVAKSFGVHCGEFFIGVGPKVTLFQTGETKWTLGAIPIMGGVKMYYDNGRVK